MLSEPPLTVWRRRAVPFPHRSETASGVGAARLGPAPRTQALGIIGALDPHTHKVNQADLQGEGKLEREGVRPQRPPGAAAAAAPGEARTLSTLGARRGCWGAPLVSKSAPCARCRTRPSMAMHLPKFWTFTQSLVYSVQTCGRVRMQQALADCASWACRAAR